MPNRSLLPVALLCLLATSVLADKKPLDHTVYDGWRTIRGNALSHDGKWILYVVAPQEGDSKVEIKSTSGGKSYSFDRGSTVSFSNDSNYVIASIVPSLADTKKAKRDKVAAADMPKSGLLILNLATGEKTKIDSVTSFQLPEKDSGWFTYRLSPPKPVTEPASSMAAKTPASPAKPSVSASAGSSLVIRSFKTGNEEKVDDVTEAALSKDGTVLAYAVDGKDEKADGIYWFDLAKNVRKAALKGKVKVLKLAINDATKELAYLSQNVPAKPTTTKDTGKPEAKKEPVRLTLFKPVEATSTAVKLENSNVPKDWMIGENSPLSFSEKGTRLFLGTAPKPLEVKPDDTPDSDKVSVDVWNWQDKKIMPAQLVELAAEQKRTYRAVVLLKSLKLVQLETEKMPAVTVSEKGDGRYALGSSDLNYQLQASWDSDYRDNYLVDVETGQAKQFAEKAEASFRFSPNAKYIFGFDGFTKSYLVFDVATLRKATLKTPTALYDELDDHPSTPPAYGEAGWASDDKSLLVYDAYDIWQLDPTGNSTPKNLTGGSGRLNLLRLRYVQKDPEAESIDLTKPLLLSAFDTETKRAGFYQLNLSESHPRPTKILLADKLFGNLLFSKTSNVIAYTQQDYVEFPDVWIAQNDFSHPQKLSNANPQQAQYNWGSAELVNWISSDGNHLQGILLRPENFSYGKKYPMITYFYERNSDTLNAYHPPAPSASTINLSYFPSNGYIVFIPDIPYKVGYPGPSALSAIVSGVLNIVNRGYVDPTKMAIQGQSWGGYEVAYLITQTNLFRCACSGAAVSNMFSAYNGIRYGTGILREGQYEHGQTRIGGSIWEKPLQFIENSPLFWLEKVQTPLLMMHNDKDGAVPYTQGIELFSGLRRLGKPAWMCTYNGEDHNLVERKNRKDWSVRMAQFFDHFLKGAPMPIWMSKGVPATLKGKTFGFELEPGPVK